MKRLQAVFTSLMITAGAAQAADIYGGIALDYGMPHSGDTVQHGTILMGARLPSLSGYFAAEADIGANFGGADYSTLRARGIYGTSFGQVTGFGSLGGAIYSGGGARETGLSASIGAETAIFGNTRLRGEVIRDFMSGTATPTTVVRAGLIQDF